MTVSELDAETVTEMFVVLKPGNKDYNLIGSYLQAREVVSLREWTEIESPWFYGALTFTTWIVSSSLAGQALRVSRAEAVDIPTVFSGFVFALVFTYLHSRPLIGRL